MATVGANWTDTALRRRDQRSYPIEVFLAFHHSIPPIVGEGTEHDSVSTFTMIHVVCAMNITKP
jgi:hypothetical protein